MNRKTDMTEEEYQELVRNIEEHSQYQMKPSLPKKWMTVTEMGDLLGLKKTDRYWLVHKNVFESKKIGGICRKTENQGRSNEICGGTGMIHTSKQLKDKVRNLSNLERLYKIYTSS